MSESSTAHSFHEFLRILTNFKTRGHEFSIYGDNHGVSSPSGTTKKPDGVEGQRGGGPSDFLLHLY